MSELTLAESPLWALEEELAALVGVPVQRGGDLLERAAAVLSSEDPPEYRYLLTREWDLTLPLAVWVMLNPSVANALESDRTITGCVGFARRWGMGGIVVVNAFALRSTDPDALLEHASPIGEHNERFLMACTSPAVRRGGPVVAAWGAHEAVKRRGPVLARQLVSAGVPLECLRITREGHPGHPGRLGYDQPRRPFVVAG